MSGSRFTSCARRPSRSEPLGAYTFPAISPAAAEVLKQALSLDEQDRAAVAGVLIESLEVSVDAAADVESAWSRAIERRVAELESAAVAAVPWIEVRERLFRGFE